MDEEYGPAISIWPTDVRALGQNRRIARWPMHAGLQAVSLADIETAC